MVASVLYNSSSITALHVLDITQSQMAAAQTQLGTGYRVSNATSNGIVFAIAQGLRSDLAGIAAVNQQLSNAQGMVRVADTSLTGISNAMAGIQSVVTTLADANVSGTARTQLLTELSQLTATVSNYIANTTYSGINLLSAGASNVALISNYGGAQYTVDAQDMVAAVLSNLTAVTTSTDAQGLLTGGFSSAMSSLGVALNSLGGDANRITSQISFNSQLSDAITSSLGSMVDADMSKVAAQLQSLQVRQQLATQELSIANQSPQAILSLFR
ncbi:MAG: flagellin [Azospirillaceae bacterium]|nr:flagellin [Azospirillaceae bacterium]